MLLLSACFSQNSMGSHLMHLAHFMLVPSSFLVLCHCMIYVIFFYNFLADNRAAEG